LQEGFGSLPRAWGGTAPPPAAFPLQDAWRGGVCPGGARAESHIAAPTDGPPWPGPRGAGPLPAPLCESSRPLPSRPCARSTQLERIYEVIEWGGFPRAGRSSAEGGRGARSGEGGSPFPRPSPSVGRGVWIASARPGGGSPPPGRFSFSGRVAGGVELRCGARGEAYRRPGRRGRGENPRWGPNGRGRCSPSGAGCIHLRLAQNEEIFISIYVPNDGLPHGGHGPPQGMPRKTPDGCEAWRGRTNNSKYKW
jgi:hypothetical protein